MYQIFMQVLAFNNLLCYTGVSGIKLVQLIVGKCMNDFNAIAEKLFKIKQTIKYYEAQEKRMLEELLNLTNKQPHLGDTYELKLVARPGLVDYKCIPELHRVNLDLYRKNPTNSWYLVENLKLPVMTELGA